MKLTGVSLYSKPVNEALSVQFARGTVVSRSPYYGMDLPGIVKVKAVQDGAPDGRAGSAISRENGTV
jgi:hypothetical protein